MSEFLSLYGWPLVWVGGMFLLMVIDWMLEDRQTKTEDWAMDRAINYEMVEGFE
jgi:hypothetical protein